MAQIKDAYLLETITKPGPLLTQALRLYVRQTPPSTRTSSNEIVYWAERYNAIFTDRLYLFVLHRNDEIIGFAQMVLFSAEELLVVDHMVIDSAHRKHNTFFEFVEQIRAYLNREDIHYRFVIVEAPSFTLGMIPLEQGRKLIRLLKFAGFGVIKAQYYQPQLGTTNLESIMRATLLIFGHHPAKSITSDTFLSIVKTIYYSHYLRWYEPFPTINLEAYRHHIDDLYMKVKSAVGSSRMIKINGSFDAPPERSMVEPSSARAIRSAGFYVALILCVFLMISWTQAILHLPAKSITLHALLAILIVLAILALFSSRALRLFERVLAALMKFFGSTK